MNLSTVQHLAMHAYKNTPRVQRAASVAGLYFAGDVDPKLWMPIRRRTGVPVRDVRVFIADTLSCGSG